MSKEYILQEGSLHEQYANLRSKIQFYGGGYGNGKTSAMIIKVLKVAKDYPGANILVARSTYPKLNDTIRRVFVEFCPEKWIESFPLSKSGDNTCTLTNGTKVNFRYIAQRRTTDDGGSSSNLLSATYDLICVDQIEDPEIVHKDFMDLFGRLRGDTVYRGTDPTMPRTGPRWMLVSSNPTRNWVYKKIIEPYHHFKQTGLIRPELLAYKDEKGDVIYKDGVPQLMLEVVEGSTYTNAHILPADFISGLESSYTGQMRDRFLLGGWAAYEGLVYPDFDENVHMQRDDVIRMYLRDLYQDRVKVTWLEGYDHGIQAPSCYLLAFVDHKGNIFIVDGFYKPEVSIEQQAQLIKEIRLRWKVNPEFIYADPSIFRRAAGATKLVGKSVAELFFEETSDILMQRGNSDIENGIVKVRSYLMPRSYHMHPIDGSPNAPYLYISANLDYVATEFSSYYWRTDPTGQRIDEPVGKDDHALDTIKYMLSRAPDAGKIQQSEAQRLFYLDSWFEVERYEDPNWYRH